MLAVHASEICWLPPVAVRLRGAAGAVGAAVAVAVAWLELPLSPVAFTAVTT